MFWTKKSEGVMVRRVVYLFLLSLPMWSHAQKVGINTVTPYSSLHIKSSETYPLTIENPAPMAPNVRTGILFANGITEASTVKFTGGIQAISTSSSEARLGLFTYAVGNSANLQERLSILDNGNVGINTQTPGYRLHVNGDAGINGALDVQGNISSTTMNISGYTTLSGNVGVKTSANSTYNLDVAGTARITGATTLSGTLNPVSPLTVGSNLNVGGALTVSNNESVGGSLTVQGGKGIVRSVNSTQLKIKRSQIYIAINNLAPGTSLSGAQWFYVEHFDSPTVLIGNLVSQTGNAEKILLVPFNINTTTNSCEFYMTNTSNSTISFEGTWEVVVMGY